MASAAKKLKMSPGVEDKPECPYGTKCYRKNPEHLKEFLHPTKDGISNGSQSKPDASAASLPPCKYGANCYRKNLMHFAEFSHPTQPTSGADSGSDTDVCESDEESKGNTTLTKGDTLMLVKSYTKMSDSERKELIQRAIAVKKQLQDELKQTREKVAEKDRELKALQDKVTTGLLLVDGEKEALEGNETKYFSLQAERAYREGSADQIHFRLAESQFYRLLSGQYSQSYRVTKVEYLVNPKLVKNFSQAREDLKKERGENLSLPVLAFHGTDQSVITKICEGGFLVPGGKGFKHKTDTGWYGKGVYFSEYPAYSMGYIQGATNLLLCQVLPGKVYQCTKLIHGASLQSGYDSHTSPDKKELVVFNSHHILPSYIVHYTNATTEFKYSSKAAQSEAELKAKYEKACKCPVKKGKGVFDGVEFTISGAMVVSQKELLALIAKHGGKAGTAKRFDLLIATENEINSGTSKVLKAREKGANTILCQDYIYDMIISKGSIKDRADYEL